MDNITPQDPMQPPMGASLISSEAPKPGLLATPSGRIMVIAGGVLAFVVVAGVVAFLVFTFLLGGESESGNGAPTTTGGSAAATGTAGVAEFEAEPIAPRDVSLSEIFTFRDIFEPLVIPSEETETPPDGSDPTSETPETSVDTLFLQDIVVKDGVATAQLIWNGTTYPLVEGGVIPGTPWQVLSIQGGTVTMLYGDAQVTLTVGQGISK